MALGGWESYDAIEPYLSAPTEENIIDSMSTAALSPTEHRQTAPLWGTYVTQYRRGGHSALVRRR